MGINRLSIRIKVVGFVTLIVLSIVAFQWYYFPQRATEQLSQALEMKATSVSVLASHEAAAGLQFEDKDLVETLFKGVAKDQDFVYVVLFSADGTPMAVSGLS